MLVFKMANIQTRMRRHADVIITQIGTPGWARTYLIHDATTSEAVLVDPVWDHIDEDLLTVSEAGLTLTAVLGTHTHADHITAGFVLSERLNLPFVMYDGARTAGVTHMVTDRATWRVGQGVLRFHAAPGHTADSMIIEGEGAIMTGDFLFNGDSGVGRDDLPGGSLEAHWEALSVLQRFDDEMLVLSGHAPPGEPPRTLGWNRSNNPILRMASFDEYRAWQEREWERLGDVSRMPVALPANTEGRVPDSLPWA